jgi:succinyl-CoA synthetase beta subunit
MDLLEYQAKELFREMGIPVLPAQRIDRPKDLKGLQIPYPVVLKSQVYFGGRARLGGVKFVENTIDAIAAAQTIFNLPIMGEYPTALLAEAKYNAEQEFYLAVALNRTSRRPVLLGSQQGGVNVEAEIEHMQYVIVDQEFSPFYARRLALKMGLQGTLIQSVSAIVEKMYRLFVEKDLDLVEINPLGVNANGEVMALDGKVSVNDAALSRHPDLAALATKVVNPYMQGSDMPFLMEPDGNIGILCNGAGLTMTTMDLIHRFGGRIANVLNIGSETRHDWNMATLCDRLEKGLDLITQNKQVKVVLVNLISSVVSCEQIAEVVTNYLQLRSRNTRNVSEIRGDGVGSRSVRLPHVFVRLVGTGDCTGNESLSATQVSWIEDLDEAIAQTVALAKTATKVV